jgi:hypothetical protein
MSEPQLTEDERRLEISRRLVTDDAFFVTAVCLYGADHVAAYVKETILTVLEAGEDLDWWQQQVNAMQARIQEYTV